MITDRFHYMKKKLIAIYENNNCYLGLKLVI